jgi:hypothetical protein
MIYATLKLCHDHTLASLKLVNSECELYMIIVEFDYKSHVIIRL